jgi:hypothetical protein
MKSTRYIIFILIVIAAVFRLVYNEPKQSNTDKESRLIKILNNWEENGGDLSGEIYKLSDYTVNTKKEAQAICHTLSSSRLIKEIQNSIIMPDSFHSLISLFQNNYINSEEAYYELGENGVPHLRDFLTEKFDTYPEENADDLLEILEVLAMYGALDDIDLIIKAARKPLKPDSYMWSEVFDEITDEHPGWERLCDGLRSPLPKGFLAIAYLDFANGFAINGKLKNHPFDSPEGILRLKEWLLNNDNRYYSYAISVVSALPFIALESRDELLLIAKAHQDVSVKIETAWAMAKTGDIEGRKQLQNWCLDVKYSRRACSYLEELGHKDEIPESCLDPDFKAIAEMCLWLSHPNEYNKPPDKIELFDKRELYWPPTEDKRKVWLFKYTYEPDKDRKDADVGIGMVGSITFALFGAETANLSPEDVYALHCDMELREGRSRRELETYNPEDGRKILRKYNKGF